MRARKVLIRVSVMLSMVLGAGLALPEGNAASARGVGEAPVARMPVAGPVPQTKAGGGDQAIVLRLEAQPAGADQGCGISGRVFDAGQPAVGVQLELYEHKPGAAGTTAERGRDLSDAEGRFRFPPIRSLAGDRALYVRYLNRLSRPQMDDHRLSAWYGPDVRVLSPEGCAEGGEFDLSDPRLIEPAPDARLPWETLFRWTPRSAAGSDKDRFQVCFADWGSGKQLACLPDRPIAGDAYRPGPAERPALIPDNVKLGWYLRLSREGDAFGYGRWQQPITFIPGPSLTPTPAVTAAPSGTATAQGGEVSPTPPPSVTATATMPATPTSTVSPPPDATQVCPGDTVKGQVAVHLPAAPLRADVLLVFDATGSMGDVIASAKDNAQQIIASLRAIVPDTRVGVAYVRDYGESDVYRLVQPLSDNAGRLQASLGDFVADGGGDGLQEAYTRLLYEAYADPQVGWRPDARRFIVAFGDQVPHDDDLNAGLTSPRYNPGGTWCGDSSFPCILDAGRDGIKGSADDLDLQTVLQELRNQEITLLFAVTDSGFGGDWRDNIVDYWRQWAEWTSPGGSAVPLESAADLPRTIVDLVRQAGSRIGRLVLEAQPPEYARWLTSRPDEMRDIFVPSNGAIATFDYELLVPGNTVIPSTHAIDLVAIADNVEMARQRVVLHVPEICIKPPTVEPSGRFRIGVPAAALRDFPGTWSSLGRLLRRSGPASGRANSALQVQNLDGERTLNARAYFFPQRVPYTRAKGSPPPQVFPVEVLGVPPGGSSNVWLPRLSLPFGIFSAVMLDDIDLPLAAVVRTDWTETGAAALYTSVKPSYELVIPVALRRYYGQSSVISVMSDGNDRPVEVELSFYRSGSATPVSPALRFQLQPYEGATFDLLDQHPAFQALGDGFAGSARLRTVYGLDPARTDDGAWIGAVAHVNIGSSKRAVWGFEAQPAGTNSSAAAAKLYVPLWRSRQRGALPADRLDTGIAVVNPNDREVEVVVDFYTTDNLSASDACRAMASFSTAPRRIAARSNHVFYQGPGGGNYPDNCFGSAVVRTTDSRDTVLAVVNDAQNLSQLSAAYNAIPAGDAADKIAIPLFRNRHGAHQLTTGIQVMNTGERTARVHIDFISPIGPGGVQLSGCGIACDAVVPPLRSHTFYPPAIEAIAPNTAGSAIIESSEPAVAIVIDYPLAGTCCVDSAAYLGLPWTDKPLPGKGP